MNVDVILCAGESSRNGRSVCNRNLLFASWLDSSFVRVEGEAAVFFIVVHFRDGVESEHLAVVSQEDLLRLTLSYCHLFKIELFFTSVHERELANSTHLKHSLVCLVLLLTGENGCSHYNFGLFRSECDDNLLFLSLSKAHYINQRISI